MSASRGTHTKSQPQSPEHPKHVYEFVRKHNENRNNEYQLLNLLGEGGFAKCYKTKRTYDKREFAIKAINLNDRSDSSSQDKKKSSRHPRVSTQQKAMAEANFLKTCNHHNIVHYETHFTYDNVFYIVMEHCSNGSFGDMLKHRKTITEVQARYYLLQMVHGLIYLKQKRIIHRDLKPANYLLNDKMELKIADFGLATEVKNGSPVFSNICGTPNYLSPEMLCKNNYCYEVDIWSLGVALERYAMLFGMPPFETKKKDAKQTYQKIKKCEYSFNCSKVSVSSQAKDLISKILILDPSKRIPLQQILEHPFMSSFNIPREISYRYLKKEPDSRFLSEYEGKIRQNHETYRVKSVGSSKEKPLYKSNELRLNINPIRYCPPEFQTEQKPEKSITSQQYEKYKKICDNIRKEMKKNRSEKRPNETQNQSQSHRPKGMVQVMKKLQQQQILTSSPISSNASIKGTSNNKYIQYPSQSPELKLPLVQDQPQSGTTSNIYFEVPQSQILAKNQLPLQASILCNQPQVESVMQIPFPSFAHMMKPLSYQKEENYDEYLREIRIDWRQIMKINLRDNGRETKREAGNKISFKIADEKARSKKNFFQADSAMINTNSTKSFQNNICSLQDFLLYASSIHVKSSKLLKMVYCLKQQLTPSIQATQASPNHSCRYIGIIFDDNSSIITKLTSSQNQLTYSSVYIRKVQSINTKGNKFYEKMDQNYAQNDGDKTDFEDFFVVELDLFQKEKGPNSNVALSGTKISLDINYELRIKLKLASSVIKLFKYTISKDSPELFTQKNQSKSQLLSKNFLQKSTTTINDFKFITMYRSRQSNLYFEMNDGSKHYLQKGINKKAHLDLFKKNYLTDIRPYRYAMYFSSKKAVFLKESGEEGFEPISLTEINTTVGEKTLGPVSRKDQNVKILQEDNEQGEFQKITKKVKPNEESSKSSNSKQSSKFSHKQNIIPTLSKSQNGTASDILQKICQQFQSKMEMQYLRERDTIIKKKQDSILKSRGDAMTNSGCEFRENRFCWFEIQNGNLELKLKKQDGL